MRQSRLFEGRIAVMLAALALAVQVSLPLFVVLALHLDSDDARAMQNAPAMATVANQTVAETAISHGAGHHCTCPICQILAAGGQSCAVASHPILAVAHRAPNALITFAPAPLFPVSFPSSYQARAPPLAG
jgi:hypothetical protein